jgi:hypothetical protein
MAAREVEKIKEQKGRARPASPAIVRSPDELRANLPDAGIASVRNLPKVRTADVTVRIDELRVIEYVEEFTPDLERLGFRDRDDLRYSEIGVIETRAMEESAVRRTEASAIRTSQNSRHQVAGSRGK